MPVSPDALFVATYHLLPKLEQNFFDSHPFLKMMIESGVDKRPSGGEYAAFDVVVDGPGTPVQLVTGAEAYSYGRKNIIRQGRIYIPTSLYPYAVEGQALRKGSGPTAIESLLKTYPEQANLDFRQKINAQILTGSGVGTGVGGFATLNGDQTFSPDGTSLTGFMSFAAKSGQTSTVENLPKEGAGTNPTTGWYNQYGAVSSFATNGKRIMRETYNACGLRGGEYGYPPIGFCDSISFDNYYDSLDDQVRYTSEKTDGEEGVNLLDGIMFHKTKLYVDAAIDDNTASFSHFSTFGGVMYFLNPKTFGILTIGEDAKMEGKGFFDLRGPFKLEGRDAWGYEIIAAFQMYCRFLKANGIVEGTAII